MFSGDRRYGFLCYPSWKDSYPGLLRAVPISCRRIPGELKTYKSAGWISGQWHGYPDSGSPVVSQISASQWRICRKSGLHSRNIVVLKAKVSTTSPHYPSVTTLCCLRVGMTVQAVLDPYSSFSWTTHKVNDMSASARIPLIEGRLLDPTDCWK